MKLKEKWREHPTVVKLKGFKNAAKDIKNAAPRVRIRVRQLADKLKRPKLILFAAEAWRRNRMQLHAAELEFDRYADDSFPNLLLDQRIESAEITPAVLKLILPRCWLFA